MSQCQQDVRRELDNTLRKDKEIVLEVVEQKRKIAVRRSSGNWRSPHLASGGLNNRRTLATHLLTTEYGAWLQREQQGGGRDGGTEALTRRLHRGQRGAQSLERAGGPISGTESLGKRSELYLDSCPMATADSLSGCQRC